MTKRIGESGNIFFTLFGAVALVGVIGVATSNLMRGPVGTVMKLNQIAKAESQLQIARKLTALEAAQQATTDCDSDGFLEPLPADAGAGACASIATDLGGIDAGAGCIPSSVGVSQNDPWGTRVGYCAWDHGPIINGVGCSSGMFGGTNGSSETVIAVISAGPDRTFDSSCSDDAGYVSESGDDIVLTWTYDDAIQGAGGLWALKSGDPDTAQTVDGRNIEVGGEAAFQSGARFASDVSFTGGNSSMLDLSLGTLLNLPDETALSVCSAANDRAVRIDTSVGMVLQICDWYGAGAWIDIGGSGAASSVYGADGDVQFNSGDTLFATDNFNYDFANDRLRVGGNAAADDTLEVTGTADFSGDVEADSYEVVTGGTAGNVGLSFNSAGNLGVYGSGSSLGLSVGGVSRFDVDNAGADVMGTLGVTGNTSIGGTLGVTGATTISGATSINNTLNVTGDISDSGGAVTVNDDLVVNNSLQVGTSFAADSFELDTIGSGEGLYMDGAGGLELRTSGVTSMQIDAGGDIGIALGVAPTTDLDVGGIFRIRSSATVAGTACGAISGAIAYSSGDELLVCSDITGNWETIGTSGGGGGGGGGIWENGGGVIRIQPDEFSNTDDFVVGSLQLNDEGSGNEDERMFFENSTGSFRAGAATGTEWDTRGNYSIGLGYNTQATTANTIAIGNNAQARATDALALGRDVTVAAGALQSMGIGLGIATGSDPLVSGTESLGIFMQDQSAVNFAANNTLGILGGRVMIDPNEPATQLATSGSLTVDVEGDVGAINFCSEDGTFCFTAEDVATGSTGAPGNDREVIFNSAGALATDTNFVFTSAGNFGLGTASPSNDFSIVNNKTSITALSISNTDPNLNAASQVNLVTDAGSAYFDLASTVGGGHASVSSQTAGGLRLIANNAVGEISLWTGSVPTENARVLSTGEFGVGTATPQTRLDVDGTIKMAYGGEACDVNRQGGIHYNSSDDNFYVCQDGAAWQRVITAGSSGGGLPASGNNTEIQFNSNGELAALPTFTYTSAGGLTVGNGAGTEAYVNIEGDNPDLAFDVPSASGSFASIQFLRDSVLSSEIEFGNNTEENLIFTADADGDGQGDILMNGRLSLNAGTDPAAELTLSEQLLLGNINDCTASTQGALRLNGAGDVLEMCDFNGSGGYISIGGGAVTAPGADTQIVYNSGGVLFASSGLVFDNGSVGIGTAAPAYALDVTSNGRIGGVVVGSASGSGLPMSVLNNASHMNFVTPTTGDFSFFAGGDNSSSAASQFTIQTNNYVGSALPIYVGSVSITPATELEVDGAIKMSYGGEACDASREGAIHFDSSADRFYVCQNAAEGWVNIATNNADPGAPDRGVQFNSGGSFAADANFIYTAGGQLGLGTASPAARFHAYNGSSTAGLLVEGDEGSTSDLNLLTSGDGASTVGTATATGWTFSARGNAFATAAVQNDLMYYYWDGSSYQQRLLLENDTGNLVLSDSDVTGDTKLDVDGTIKMSYGGEACDVAREGAIHYNSSDDKYYVCASAGSWIEITTGGAAASPAPGSDTQIVYNSGGVLYASSGFTFTSAGRVGLGGTATANPQSDLHIDRSGSDAGIHISAQNGTHDPYISFLNGYVSQTDDWSIGRDDSNSGAFTISGDASLGTDNKLTILQGGAVGIGTSAPVFDLHVHNESANNVGARFTNGNSGALSSDGFAVGLDMGTATDGGFVWVRENLPLKMATNDIERLRVDNDGVVRFLSSGAAILNTGTTGQRPVTPENGMIRYNTDNDKFEAYQGGTWEDIITSAIGGGAADPDRGIQFKSGQGFAADANFVYTSAGYVGIGVPTPSTRLSLAGEGVANGITLRDLNVYAYPGTNYVTIGSSGNGRLFVDAGNGDVYSSTGHGFSIDTQDPITFETDNGNDTGIGGTSELNFFVTDGVTPKMRLTSSGQFGVGSLTPDTALDVAGTIKMSYGGEACDASREGAIHFDSAADKFYVCPASGSWQEITTGGATASPAPGSDTQIVYNSGGVLYASSGLIFTSAGRLGVGTIAPSEALTVGGNTELNGQLYVDPTNVNAFMGVGRDMPLPGAGAQLAVSTSGNTDASVIINSDGNGNSRLVFSHSETERYYFDYDDVSNIFSLRSTDIDGSSTIGTVLRIDDGAGNVLVPNGAVGVGLVAPQTALDIDGTIKMSYGGEACDASREGAIHFDSAADRFFVCQAAGEGWVQLATNNATAADPDRGVQFKSGDNFAADANFIYNSAGELQVGNNILIPRQTYFGVNHLGTNISIAGVDSANNVVLGDMTSNTRTKIRLLGASGGSPTGDIRLEANAQDIMFMNEALGTESARFTSAGRLGIGVTDPSTILDIAGTIQIADGGETCSAVADGGMVRWNGTVMQYCDGATWQNFANGASASPAAPDRGIQFNSGGAFAADANLVLTSAGVLRVAKNASGGSGIDDSGVYVISSNPQIGIRDTGSAIGWALSTGSGGDFSLGTQNESSTKNDLFTFTSSGRLGVGTATPSQKFVVQDGLIFNYNTADAAGLMAWGNGNGGQYSYLQLGDNVGGHNWGIRHEQGGADNNALDFSFNTVGLMTLTSAGRLGIGLTDPSTILDVAGTIQVADGGEACSVAADGGMVRWNGTVMQYCDGATWQNFANGASASPGAPDRGIQFNSGGAFTADANFTYTNEGDFIVGSSQIDDTTTGAEDSRLYFDLSNGAFRAGSASGNHWDYASSGQYSVAMGSDTVASANYSVAMGLDTTASNTTSVAMGLNTTASGLSSTALGWDSIASGNVTFAAGRNVDATGDYSAALGFSTTASGEHSLAMGRGTTASGDSSIAMGRYTSAGDHSMAIGLISTNPATIPVVSGTQSVGIFMGDHNAVDFSAANTFGLFGGSMVIDPADPATNLSADTALEVEGSLKIAYGGEACDAAREGAIRFDSAADTFSFCADNATGWESITLGSGTLAALGDTNITGPSTGEVLYYSNGEWVNNVLAINDLSDAVANYTSGSMYMGQGAGASMVSGNITNNTFLGYNAGTTTNGSREVTIIGSGAASAGGVGNYNTLIGANAGRDGPGANNVMVGDSAGLNSTGSNNVFVGSFASTRTTSGNDSIVIGNYAGGSGSGANGVRERNTIVGHRAGDDIGPNANRNTFFGYSAGGNVSTGTDNLLIGYGVDTPFATANNYINIGNVLYGSAGTGELFLGSAGTGGAVRLPTGGVATRPGDLAGTAAVNGMIRYNTTSDKFEAYQGGSWQDILTSAVTGGASAPDRGVQFNSGGDFAADANFVFTSAGRLGIGVTNPTRDVVVSGDEGLTVQGDTISGRLYIGGYSDGGSYAFMNLDDYTNSRTWSMSHAVSDNGLGISYYDGSSSVVMRFTSAGSVGVGTITPQTQLDVDGTIKVSYGGEACDAAREGSIRFMSTTNSFTFCANNANGWETVSLGGGTLSALTDTNIAAPATGNILYYSGSEWVNNALAINDLSDGITNYTSGNIYVGQGAGGLGTTASYNTAFGSGAGASISSGGSNTVFGYAALNTNSTGGENVAIGRGALFTNNASSNTAIGTYALLSNDTGTDNTAIGRAALYTNIIGNNNVAFGRNALVNATGDSNTALGAYAGTTTTTGTNNILIGAGINALAANSSNYINIGNMFYGSAGTGELFIGGSGALALPSGAIASRPGDLAGTTAVNGMIRYNTTSDKFEAYQGGSWQDILTSAVAGGASAPDRGIQFNSGGDFAASSELTFTADGNLVLDTLPASHNDSGASLVMAGDNRDVYHYSLDGGATNGADYHFRRSNAGGAVSNGYKLGGLRFEGWDGDSWERGALIYSEVDGTVANEVMPTDLDFYTRDVTDTNPVKRMDILANGTVRFLSSGAVQMPIGSTAQRPSVSVNGMIRYNSSNDRFEGYQGGIWQDILTSAVAGGASAPDRGIQFNSGGDFAADANFTYTSTGSLGVGTATPNLLGTADRALTVSATGANEVAVLELQGNGAVNANSTAITFFNGAAPIGSITSRVKGTTSSGALTFTTLYDGTPTEVMRLSEFGAMGVGTIAPQTKLDVNGTLRIAYGGEACDAAREGAIRYDSSSDTFSFCALQANGWEAISLGGGTLAALTDTNISGPASGQILYYSGSEWVNNALALGNLGDVDTTGFADGNVLLYSAGAGNWVPGDAPIVGAFTDLSDTPANYTGQGGRFARVNSGETAIEFTDEVIRRVSGEPLPVALNLNDLGDVSASATDGQFLSYNSSTGNWIAANIGTAGGLWTAGSGDDIYYNSGTPRVGIGTTSPVATFEVAGDIKFASSSLACNAAAHEGAMQFGSGGSNIFEVCANSATGWEQLALGGTVAGALNDLSDVDTTGFADGNVLLYSAGAGSWVADVVDLGASNFTELADTPANYSGQSGRFARVNSGETALEFTDQIIESVTGQPAPNTINLNDLGDVSASATDGQYLSYDSASGTWVAATVSGGGGTPAGADSQIQFNSGGAFGATANFVYTSAGRLGLGMASPTRMMTLAMNDDSIRILDSNDSNNERVDLGVDSFNTGYITVDNASEQEVFFTDTGGTILGGFHGLVIRDSDSFAIPFNQQSAALHFDVDNRGFLPPTNADPATNIATPATGLIAFDTTDNELQMFDGATWTNIGAGASGVWSDSGAGYIEYSSTLGGVKIASISGASAPTGAIRSSASLALGGLTDVTIAGAADGEVLLYSAGAGAWIDSTLTLTDLGNVDTTGFADGDVLLYSAGAGGWIAGTSSGGATPAGNDRELQFNSGGGLGADTNLVYSASGYLGVGTSTPSAEVDVSGDVNLSGYLNLGQMAGDAPTYISSGFFALNELTDVDTAGYGDGDVILYSAGAGGWIAGTAAAGASALNDLTDVDTAGFADGNVLLYSAGAGGWVAGVSGEGSGAGLVGTINYAGATNCAWTTTSGTWETLNSPDADCPAPTTTGSAQAPSEGLIPAIRFASLPAGEYEVTVTAQFLSGSNCRFRLTDGTTTSGITTVTGHEANVLTGVYEYSTNQSNITFYVQGIRTLGSNTCYIYADEAGVLDYTMYVKELGGGSGSGGASLLSELGDVDTSGFADGNVLLYSAGAGSWVAGTSSGGGGAINDLSDGIADATNLMLGSGKTSTYNVQNTVVGVDAFGANNASSQANTVMGWEAMADGTGEADYNTAIGRRAGRALSFAIHNTFVGYDSGQGIGNGDYNVFVGSMTGNNMTDGSNNILIGYDIEPSGATVSNELNIGNTIFGQNIYNAAPQIGINNSNPAYTLDVTGDIHLTSSLVFEPVSGLGAPVYMSAGSTSLALNGLTDVDTTGFADGDVLLYSAGAGNWVAGTASGGGGASAINDLSDAITQYSSGNMFIGQGTGAGVTTAENNTALGINALASNGVSNHATAVGAYAAQNYNPGDQWQAIVAIGTDAARYLTTGRGITAVGNEALRSFPGDGNTAIGSVAMFASNGGGGDDNVGIGNGAGSYMSGNDNVIIGGNAFEGGFGGDYDHGGNGNIIIGRGAAQDVQGSTTNYNVIIGRLAAATLRNGSSNILIGDNVDVASGTTSNYLNIGDVFYGSTGTGELYIGGTGALKLPAGDSTTRPGTLAGTTAVDGMIRYNSASDRFEGYQAGTWQDILTGSGGVSAINDLSDGYYNGGNFTLALGAATGNGGDQNTFVGYAAGQAQTDARDTVAIGYRAGRNLDDGRDNIIIGSDAGSSISTGSNNIVIGSSADASGSNRLNIGNTIYGNLSSDYVGIGVTSPSVALDVLGDIEYTGTITDVSDRRLKTDITPLSADDVMSRLAQIDTYSFRMKDDESGRVELGVMAQEVEKVFPELVKTANDEMGTKSVNYVGFVAPLIEASKELKAENDMLRAEIDDMKLAQARFEEDIMKEVKGLKAHTGYGIDKAQIGLWTIALLFGFSSVFFMVGGILRHRQRKQG